MTERQRVWLGRLALVAAWAVCGWYLVQRYEHARAEFANKPDAPAEERRADGNGGHAQIDFGGQWVLARLVATGHGRELYHRREQWEAVRAGYPADAGLPNALSDADNLMEWFIRLNSPATTSQRGDIGGPLYPPVHALLYAPLGFLPPAKAYHLFQLLSVGLTLFAGLGVSRLTRGRVWWPVATAGILLFPGFRSGLDLAQNSALTLCILVWGWALAAGGREWVGGVVWGLLAYKPSWGVAFILAPLLLGQWRFCLTMVVSGVALVLATLPVVGVQAWFDWLEVGREASAVYAVNRNWIELSRDLAGIPRRWLIDFNRPEADRGSSFAATVGWALWGGVLVATAVIVRLSHREVRRFAGPVAGFAQLGVYLCCYRFMYYDAVLAVLPVAVLVGASRAEFRWVAVGFAVVLCGYENYGIHYIGHYKFPTDTILLVALWLWTGALLLVRSESGTGPKFG